MLALAYAQSYLFYFLNLVWNIFGLSPVVHVIASFSVSSLNPVTLQDGLVKQLSIAHFNKHIGHQLHQNVALNGWNDGIG